MFNLESNIRIEEKVIRFACVDEFIESQMPSCRHSDLERKVWEDRAAKAFSLWRTTRSQGYWELMMFCDRVVEYINSMATEFNQTHHLN